MDQACLRCGSPDYLEATRLLNVFEEGGKTFYKYDLKCNKCGRSDPYTSENGELIDPRTALRNQLEAEGLQKQSIVGRINPNSDQSGAAEWLEKHNA